MIVVGDSLLRATEAPICQPDAHSRGVCCLPGACIRDVIEKLPSLVESTDYYLLLLFHVDTHTYSNTTRNSLRSVKKTYRALGEVVRDSEVQVFFSSILLVKGKDFERASGLWQINDWLWDWCHTQGFSYLEGGTQFENPEVSAGE